MVWRWMSELDRLRDDVNSLLSGGWGRPPWGFASRTEGPPVNVYETPEEFLVTLDAPGADRDTFDVSITSGYLNLRGEYESPEVKGTLARAERPTGPFGRMVRLPEDVDTNKVYASFENGVLTVRVAKAEAAKPKLIEVKVN